MTEYGRSSNELSQRWTGESQRRLSARSDHERRHCLATVADLDHRAYGCGESVRSPPHTARPIAGHGAKAQPAYHHPMDRHDWRDAEVMDAEIG